MYKKILTIFGLIFSLNVSAWAYNHPTPEVFFKLDSDGSKIVGDSNNIGNILISSFKRVYSKDSLMLSGTLIKTSISKKPKLYHIYYAKEKFIRQPLNIYATGAYLFRETENDPFGYCLIEPLTIHNLPATDSTVTKIRTLTFNPNYYTGNKVPADIQVRTYEKDHGDYIERYITVKSRYYELLMVDSMYPKGAEVYLKDFIYQNIEEYSAALSKIDSEWVN